MGIDKLPSDFIVKRLPGERLPNLRERIYPYEIILFPEESVGCKVLCQDMEAGLARVACYFYNLGYDHGVNQGIKDA
jgi:hypothetical protein